VSKTHWLVASLKLKLAIASTAKRTPGPNQTARPGDSLAFVVLCKLEPSDHKTYSYMPMWGYPVTCAKGQPVHGIGTFIRTRAAQGFAR
jgi:hypothetical protein